MSNDKIIETFLLEYQHKLEKGTLLRYKMALQEFFKANEYQVEKVTSQRIRKWLLSLQEQGYAEKTINLKISALKTFYKYCMEDEIVKHNPLTSISFLQVPMKPPYYLSVEQLNQLRQLVKSDLGKRLVVELLYSTGLRISEMLNIKREHINWEERFIFIPKSKRKKERIVCFTKDCASYLETFLANRVDNIPYVFFSKLKKGPPTQRKINYHFEAYSRKLNFTITPHTLRHTFAAHLAQKGMPLFHIQTLLGHEDPQQTEYYARLYHDAQKEIYDQWMN